MILMLDTSTPTCRLALLVGDNQFDYEWEAGRQLAKGLLGYIQQCLADQGASFRDLTGLAVMDGPGSFTGLRIGLTVMNTLADSLSIPIVACRGDAWQLEARQRLAAGSDDQIVMPHYGADANITKPRK